jgi:hypothetical protein
MRIKITIVAVALAAILALPAVAVAADDVGQPTSGGGTTLPDGPMGSGGHGPAPAPEPAPSPAPPASEAPTSGGDAPGYPPTLGTGAEVPTGDPLVGPPAAPDPPGGAAVEQEAFTCAELAEFKAGAWDDMIAVLFFINLGEGVWDELRERAEEVGDWLEQEKQQGCGRYPRGGHPLYTGTSDGSEGGPAL